MVQGFKKSAGGASGGNAKNKARSAAKKGAIAKKGSVLKLPTGKFRDQALDDRALSKAIDKANEKKVAAKLLQSGGRMTTADLMQKGKEASREARRKQLKRKLTRVEEKLKVMQAKEEAA